jgi:ribulose-phosphate 3-epimerase
VKTVTNKNTKIAPSILSADFSRLGEQVAAVSKAGADYIHVDVMDGHFVPNITIGAPVVECIRSWTDLPLDVHLMIDNPEDFVRQFADAGADILTVHIELGGHLHRLIQQIRDCGMKAGIALNPATPAGTLEEILPYVDLVLIMTVNPGFGGQSFIDLTGKIEKTRSMIDDIRSQAELEVDGGINNEIIPRLMKAGVNVFVSGSALFSKPDIAEAIRDMKKVIELSR